jgi:hypothetical protein
MKKRLLNTLVIGCALSLSGCSSMSSSAKRAAITGAASLTAGAAVNAATKGDATKTLLASVAAATVAQAAEGEDPNVRQSGFDQGYVHGQSDAIKREYFLRHAREAEPLTNPNGETVYYVMPGPEVTVDGRKLEPHHVAVRVVE